MDQVIKIIDQHKLGSIIRYILENNPSQALPYHSFSHSLWVLYNCYDICKYEKKDAPKELLIAALFHDFDHTGGFYWLGSDDKNVIRAISRFNECWNYGIIKDDVDKPLVQRLIFITEYPHREITKMEGEITTQADDIFQFLTNALRDADMLQTMRDTQLHDLVAIKEEYFKYMPWKEYTEKSVEFLQSIKFKTKFGLKVGKELQDEALNRLLQFRHAVFS